MNILISNDDGVFAPGILAAKQAVEDLANVCVVAPDKNNSSVGRRLTLFKHLEINQCELDDGSPAYSVSGSPADCVVVGADYVMDAKPDLVISGINQGVNISCDITSSGTVCAAFEAVVLEFLQLQLHCLWIQKHPTCKMKTATGIWNMISLWQRRSCMTLSQR